VSGFVRPDCLLRYPFLINLHVPQGDSVNGGGPEAWGLRIWFCAFVIAQWGFCVCAPVRGGCVGCILTEKKDVDERELGRKRRDAG